MDRFIPERYSADDLRGKAVCKAALQKTFGLPVDENATLIASISRLADQKGFDLIAQGFRRLVSPAAFNTSCSVRGSANTTSCSPSLPGNTRSHSRLRLHMRTPWADLIEAGAGMFLMPSQY